MGIAFMHQQNIVHLDLKPENIVCVDTTGTSIKIIDFGLARKFGMTKKMIYIFMPLTWVCWICVLSFVMRVYTDGTTDLKVMHGTPEFVAPEVINYEPVCLATDMWSIGVICYILWVILSCPHQKSILTKLLTLLPRCKWTDWYYSSDSAINSKHVSGSLWSNWLSLQETPKKICVKNFLQKLSK